MSGGTPRIAVVIPTYRRADLLARCLRALLRQDLDHAAFEIVVADDGPDAATRLLVQRYAAQCGAAPLIRYLEVSATQGPAGARNCGWRAATAPVIAFTDDDTVPEPAWLRAGLAALEGRAVAAAGRVVVPLPERPTDYELDASGLARAAFVTANCFVRREALQRVGGFDERFTAAWREDSDLEFTLIETYGLGCITQAVDARVEHPVRPARWGVSLSQQRKALFEALLYKKHRGLYQRLIRRPLRHYYASVAALAAAALFLFAGAMPAALAALALWLSLALRFALRRLRHTSHRPGHVVEMLVTSLALPPLSLFWRLRGALRFRVLFI